jgi:transcriptional regulator with XRE-family HTH domain
MSDINNCLRKYRKARGLKQKDVAKILGLKSTSMISRWENGISLPSTQNLLKLAVLYRTIVDALFIDLIREFKEKTLKKEQEIMKKKVLKKVY